MVVTVSSADARSVKALALLKSADRWIKGHRKSDGRAFFAVPGSRGHVYNVDTRACTCPDFERNSQLEQGFACKHVLAVRMWKLQGDGEAKNAPKPKRAPMPAPSCRVCTAALAVGMLAGVCAACDEAGLTFGAVAAITAAFGSEAGAVVQVIG